MNWSTFLLEVLNFLVLLWILKRFLYKPVLESIARRQSGVEQTLAQAAAAKAAACELQTQYESRLSQWAIERENARENLRKEIAEQREAMLVGLKQELEQEREKSRVLEEKRQADSLRKFQETALGQAAQFAAKLLSSLAGQEQENRLFALVLEQLDALPDARLSAIRLACEEASEVAWIVSAYPLEAERRQQLIDKLGTVLGMPVVCHFAEDSGLLAGLRINFGPWVFFASLADELKSFAVSAHENA